MDISSAQYIQDETNTNTIVKIVVDDETMFVPLDLNNRHYAEVLKQVESGDLTIADAD